MKKNLLVTLVFCIALALFVPTGVGASSQYISSGSPSVPKMSQQEIAQLLKDHPATTPASLYSEVPNGQSPYRAGTLSPELLSAMTGRLNAMRQIAGLPAVTNSEDFNVLSQHGVVVVAANGMLSHYPSKPADMDEAFYQTGYRGASTSNLAMGIEPVAAIDLWMNDSDSSNVAALGHRRWQLNPELGKVGFGYYNGVAAERVVDKSGAALDYDFIAWPASGNFPTQLFSGREAWSITLNPEKINWQQLRQADLSITVQNSVGKTWTLQGGQSYSPAGTGPYLTYSTNSYGVGNCIIFCLDGVQKYEGVYTVTVQGAKDWNGNSVDLFYQVNFFDANSVSVSDNQPDHQPQLQEISDFVTRLYETCLDRSPDAAGLSNWVNALASGQQSGAQVAYGFVFSNEFKGKNYCNEDYVKQLYRAFLGREADSAGLADWVNRLQTGTTREEVFNGFSQSNEFRGLCGEYGITLGDPIAIPEYGTVPTGSCSVCGETDGVTAFVTRLYDICLDRKPDAAGLKDWANQLWNHSNSGRGVAYGFIFSDEFQGKNYDNGTYVEYLYKAFLGRSSDAAGKADWLNRMAQGWTREQIFDGFVGSNEFTGICQSYGIVRG